MFRNDGYINLCRIRKTFSMVSLRGETRKDIFTGEIYKEYRHRLRRSGNLEALNTLSISDNRLEEAQRSVKEYEVREAVNLRIENAFRRFLYQQQLYLSGPSGNVVQVSQDVASPHGYVYGAASPEPWDYLSNKYLTVSSATKLQTIEAAKIILIQAGNLRIDKSTQKKLLSLVDLENGAKALLPYDGYFLAVRNDLITDVKDVEKWVLPGKGLHEATATGQRGGRPRKLEQAAEAYVSLFPNGHNGMTWKEVRALIHSEAGLDVSVDTITRAVRELKSQRTT